MPPSMVVAQAAQVSASLPVVVRLQGGHMSPEHAPMTQKTSSAATRVPATIAQAAANLHRTAEALFFIL